MKSIHNWLDEYGVSHQHRTNKMIHWICVPAIFFSIIGLLFSIKLPFEWQGLTANAAWPMLAFVTVYYALLSPKLAAGMLLFSLLCLAGCSYMEKTALPLWAFSIAIFVIAWVGQFYGHKLEGMKPSFFKDLQFLLIGPAWLMSFIYRRIGLTY